MSTLTEIEAAAETLPREQLRELLVYLTAKLEHSAQREKPPVKFEISTGRDGLPVIRGGGSVITSAMVRDIEGLVR